MLKRLSLLFLFSVVVCFVRAQQTTAIADTLVEPAAAPGLRISILTCSPGPEVWETFGHACIRVIDSSKTNGERDVIYNYGFFETNEDNTIWHQAFTGRVVDLLDTITFDELMYEYNIKKRGITEQLLLLTDAEKAQVLAYLKNNLKRANRYYEFDTFYDNCSTRIRDLFRKLFGNAFVFGRALPEGSRITFRDVTVTPLCPAQHKYWFGFAVNMLYASPTDHVMTNDQALFSPGYLCRAFDGATLNGRKVCAPRETIRQNNVDWGHEINMPFLILLCIAILTVAVTLLRVPKGITSIVHASVLILTAAIGLTILYVWNIDGEPAWKYNYNILWALPTNLVLPFIPARLARPYAVVAIAFLFGALLFNLLRIQQMPAFELAPLWFSLIFIYGYILRKKRS